MCSDCDRASVCGLVAHRFMADSRSLLDTDSDCADDCVIVWRPFISKMRFSSPPWMLLSKMNLRRAHSCFACSISQLHCYVCFKLSPSASPLGSIWVEQWAKFTLLTPSSTETLITPTTHAPRQQTAKYNRNNCSAIGTPPVVMCGST